MTAWALGATGGLLLLAGLLLGRCTNGRSRRGRTWVRRRDRRQRSVPVLPVELPEGHQPPDGLGPISSSERSLSAESARGLRDLQLFLFDPA